ncbi:MAG: hypothetical protein CBC48_06405 [bacterium TMED88]|nr:MAG: hypothetical protein CBC48_06405 [bacterium TMED88]
MAGAHRPHEATRHSHPHHGQIGARHPVKQNQAGTDQNFPQDARVHVIEQGGEAGSASRVA